MVQSMVQSDIYDAVNAIQSDGFMVKKMKSAASPADTSTF